MGIPKQFPGAGEQSPQLPLASHVWIAELLHIASLPHGCVVLGTHEPVHSPRLQMLGHGIPSIQLPVSSQVCGVTSEHCFVPGTHVPAQAPLTQAYGHCPRSTHCPASEHCWSMRPWQPLAVGVHTRTDDSAGASGPVDPASMDAPPVDDASDMDELPPAPPPLVLLVLVVLVLVLLVLVLLVPVPPVPVVLVPAVVAAPLAPVLDAPPAASWPTGLPSS
jgi:hypothetical protein